MKMRVCPHFSLVRIGAHLPKLRIKNQKVFDDERTDGHSDFFKKKKTLKNSNLYHQSFEIKTTVSKVLGVTLIASSNLHTLNNQLANV